MAIDTYLDNSFSTIVGDISSEAGAEPPVGDVLPKQTYELPIVMAPSRTMFDGVSIPCRSAPPLFSLAWYDMAVDLRRRQVQRQPDKGQPNPDQRQRVRGNERGSLRKYDRGKRVLGPE